MSNLTSVSIILLSFAIVYLLYRKQMKFLDNAKQYDWRAIKGLSIEKFVEVFQVQVKYLENSDMYMATALKTNMPYPSTSVITKSRELSIKGTQFLLWYGAYTNWDEKIFSEAPEQISALGLTMDCFYSDDDNCYVATFNNSEEYQCMSGFGECPTEATYQLITAFAALLECPKNAPTDNELGL